MSAPRAARLVFVLFFVLAVIDVHGQTVRDTEAYVSGGVAAPVGPSSARQIWKPGYSLGLGIGLPVVHRLRLRPFAAVSRMQNKSNPAASSSEPSAQSILEAPESLTTLTASLDLVFSLQSRYSLTRFSPYMLGGAGYYRGFVDETTGAEPDPAAAGAALAIRGGLGMAVRISNRVGLFAEGKYSYSFVKPDRLSMVPITIGIAYLP